MPNAVQSSGSSSARLRARHLRAVPAQLLEVSRACNRACDRELRLGDRGDDRDGRGCEQAASEHRPVHAVRSTAPALRPMDSGARASARTAAVSSGSARSVLVITSRSAAATCLMPSGLLRQMQRGVDRIDRRDHVAEPEVMPHAPARPASVYRIGPGSASPVVSITTRSNSGISPRSRRPSSPRNAPLQIVADAAADAAALQQHDRLVHALDQQMVEPDLAELVDEHHRARISAATQQPLQQRRLPAAEEAGQDVDRDRRWSAGARIHQPRCSR